MPGSKRTAIKQVLFQDRIRFQSSRNLHEDALKGGRGGGVRWLFFSPVKQKHLRTVGYVWLGYLAFWLRYSYSYYDP